MEIFDKNFPLANVSHAYYDNKVKQLYVTFIDTVCYVFHEVPFEVVEKWQKEISNDRNQVNQFFIDYIKSNYQFDKK